MHSLVWQNEKQGYYTVSTPTDLEGSYCLSAVMSHRSDLKFPVHAAAIACCWCCTDATFRTPPFMTIPHSPCSVHIQLASPSFVPGSRLSATLTLRATSPDPENRPSASLPPSRASIPQQTSLTASTSAAHRPTSVSFIASEPAVTVDYLVCEVAARWSAERAWVVPNIHPEKEFLDRSDANLKDENGDPIRNRWDAALADGNLVGGGGRAGYSGLVFRSPVHVVCEREQILPGGQVSFSLECILPDLIPPTLRGTALRYTYALIVVAALRHPSESNLSPSPRVIRVPFRVVTSERCLSNNTSSPTSQPYVIPVPTPRNVGPRTNRFLDEETIAALDIKSKLIKTPPLDDIEIALALSLNGRLTPYPSDGDPWKSGTYEIDEGALNTFEQNSDGISGPTSPLSEGENGLPRKSLRSRRQKPLPVYSISRGNKLIARMFMTKPVHHLGDTVSAVFDFSTQTLECYQLSARLEVQEIISSQYALGTKQSSRLGVGNDEQGIVFRKIYGEHCEFVMMNSNTHVTFSIPHDAPVSFATDAVRIQWFIHFTFYTPVVSEVAEEGGERRSDEENDEEVVHGDVEEATTLLGRVFLGGRGHSSSKESEAPLYDESLMPERNVDVLQWTLPLTVTGLEAGWGTRPSATMHLT